MKDEVDAPSRRYVVPAVEQASRVLFCLAEAEPYLSLLDICARVGIHKSKAFSILETLQGFGLVRKGGDGKGYALGPALIFLSQKTLDHLSVPLLAEPILKDLARETGCTAVLGLIDGPTVFIAGKADGEGDFGVTMRMGHRLGLTYGAHGKAIVSSMPERERKMILKEKNLYFYGNPDLMDRPRLDEEFARCLRDGFAEDLGEVNPGLHVEAAPVFGPAGAPIGFIEIFVLFRKETAHEMGPLVARAAETLSRELGAAPGPQPSVGPESPA